MEKRLLYKPIKQIKMEKMTFDEFVNKQTELRRIQGENKMKHISIIEEMKDKLELETEQAKKDYMAKVKELRKEYRATNLKEAERYRQQHIEVETELMRVKNQWETQQECKLADQTREEEEDTNAARIARQLEM